jgi:hypothetical protein
MDFPFFHSSTAGITAPYPTALVWLAGLFLLVALAYRSAWRWRVQRARQGYWRWQAKRVVVAFLVFVATDLALIDSPLGRGGAFLLALGAALLSLVLIRPPRRSRYIPADVRKTVLRRDLGHEGRYDSRRHAIDHRVPYSKGGENTVDNLRVLGCRENARKRDRMPTRQDFQRRPRRRVIVRPQGLLWFALEGMVSVWAFWEVLRQTY